MDLYKPLVSIIIAVYNGGDYLEGAIKSILVQEYKNYEIIIIDGGSSDNTLEIIDLYKQDIFYTISEPDNGIYSAWNKGLKVASGDWIAFLGSDDILYPHAFQSYINYITDHPNKELLEFISSRINLVNNNLEIIDTVGKAWDWPLFKRNMITWHVGCFHSKNLFAKYGLFDEDYKVSGDYELLLRPKELLQTGYLPVTTVMMRDGGVSTRLLFKAIDETYRAKVKNKIISSSISPLLIYNNKVKLFIKMFLVRIGFIEKL
ncbi:glycosyltransferase [Spirosoma sp. HMF4905]|uniref:Glycosyltransferase n=1 Tax=Spirosoma arboris TaxID=2682092 RepID=A0A7K1SJT8_9BACT|nr:glycosyltransferase family 2 protein [Spirosoma arboris]MVM34081.1 glycosyltransferase [Spirosoma arboris]